MDEVAKNKEELVKKRAAIEKDMVEDMELVIEMSSNHIANVELIIKSFQQRVKDIKAFRQNIINLRKKMLSKK